MHLIALAFLTLCTPARAQDGDPNGGGQPATPAPAVTGATIPVMRAPSPDPIPDTPVNGAAQWGNGSGQPTQAGTQIAPPAATAAPPPTAPAMTVMRPVPETQPEPKPLPRIETPSQIAADQALRRQADAAIATYAERVSDTCDTDLKARIDWTEIDPQQIHVNSPADACGAALQAIEELCGTRAAQRRIAQQIKTVICTGGGKPSVGLAAGTLLYTIDWQSRNPAETVYAWLATHL